jgi:hypothetical protein
LYPEIRYQILIFPSYFCFQSALHNSFSSDIEMKIMHNKLKKIAIFIVN